MIKLVELAAKTAENLLKVAVATTSVVATKTAIASVEESEKISNDINQRVEKHKEVQLQIDKLFD